MKKIIGKGLFLSLMLGVSSAFATAINVPNYSFEGPGVGAGGASIAIDSWNQNGADNNQGVAGNGWGGGQINLPNSDGDQVGWMNTQPDYNNDLASVGLWQLLPETYTVGKAYELTVAMARGTWNAPDDGDQMQIRLWYDGVNGATAIASTTVTAGDLNWSNGGALIDYTAVLPTISATDDWAGKNIGIWLVSTYEELDGEGDWVMDNVRLNEVPEPASMALLGLGAVASLRRRRNV